MGSKGSIPSIGSYFNPWSNDHTNTIDKFHNVEGRGWIVLITIIVTIVTLPFTLGLGGLATFRALTERKVKPLDPKETGSHQKTDEVWQGKGPSNSQLKLPKTKVEIVEAASVKPVVVQIDEPFNLSVEPIILQEEEVSEIKPLKENSGIFIPYSCQLEFSSELQGKNLNSINYNFSTPEEETSLFKVLDQRINIDHQKVKIKESDFSNKKMSKFTKESFEKLFDLKVDQFGYIQIQPKKMTETVEDGTTRIEYSNGVKEEICECKDERFFDKRSVLTVKRIFPTSDVYPTGKTEFMKLDPLTKDPTFAYVSLNGKYSFLDPSLWERFDKEGSNFTEVDIDGKMQIFPIKKLPESDWWVSNEDAGNAEMLKFARNSKISQFREMMEHPHLNTINKKDFLNFLMIPNAGDNQRPPLFSLPDYVIWDVIDVAKEHGVDIDFKIKDPINNEDLLTYISKHSLEKIRNFLIRLLPNNPSVASELINIKDKFFEFVTGHYAKKAYGQEFISSLIKKIDSCCIQLNEENAWIKRAVEGSCLFEDEDFNKLSPDLKEKIYTVSNVYNQIALVGRLNGLGMGEVPLLPTAPFIISSNMDVIQRKAAIGQFLTKLRNNKSLFYATEQLPMHRENYRSHSESEGLHEIALTEYIQEIVKTLGLTSIKFRKQIGIAKLVISAEVEDGALCCLFNNVEFLEEKIKETKRLLTSEEVMQLCLLFKLQEYLFLQMDEFVVTQDGVYIDHVYHNDQARSRPNPLKIDLLKKYLPKLEHPWLENIFKGDNSDFNQRYEELKKRCPVPLVELRVLDKQEEKNQKKFGYTAGQLPMKFNLLEMFFKTPELLKNNVEGRKVWDTIGLWKQLANAIGGYAPSTNSCTTLEQVDEILKVANNFPVWFQDNKKALDKIELLDMTNHSFKDIPSEIKLLEKLKGIRFCADEMEGLPKEYVGSVVTAAFLSQEQWKEFEKMKDNEDILKDFPKKVGSYNVLAAAVENQELTILFTKN